MRNFFIFSMLFVLACGDKDTDKPVDTADTSDSADTSLDTNDTSDTSDSVDSVDSVDTEPQTTCQSPEFSKTESFYWKDPQQYGGYTATITQDYVIVANLWLGLTYAIAWSSEGGYIEDLATITFSGTALGIDKAMYSEGYLAIADALALNVGGLSTGAVYIYKEDTLSTLSGEVTLEESADITIYGETAGGWTGSFVAADVDSDGRLDAIVATGPVPGEIAVFSDIESLSGDLYWDQADFHVPNVCTDSSGYQATNMKIFGTGYGDGLLAAGCPMGNYRTGEVLVYLLPLDATSTPAATVSDVAGWRMDSNGLDEPLYIDARGEDRIAVSYQEDSSLLTTTVSTTEEDFDWWGASPTVTTVTNTSGESCNYLAVGDQGYTYKGDETGALYATLVGSDFLPTDWISLSIPSGETDSLKYIGAVNEFSLDGMKILSTGWKRGKSAEAGGFLISNLSYE